VSLAEHAPGMFFLLAVAYRGAHRLATDHARQTKFAHQPFDRASGNIEPFTAQLPPNFAHTIDTKVGIEHPLDFWL
jgi:hypothetical protein